VKKLVDRSVAAMGLIVLAPVIAVVALVVMLRLGRPVIFRQVRPGFKGELFEVYKFRTMLDRDDSSGRPLPDGERLTPLGRFLRTLSLDELPQLVNVVRGDLSIVGPRPLLVQYLTRYNVDQGRRHDVLPGITGWAQVNGRNSVDWDDRFKLDVWYVDHWSLMLDIKILFRTVFSLLRPKGVNRAGHATMYEFMGSGGCASDLGANSRLEGKADAP
jgi:lipopolysaccharide/colanic/teichoic acid biosynthesis glycosyltransferase